MFIAIYILLLLSLVAIVIIVNNLGNDQSFIIRKRLQRLKIQAQDNNSAGHRKQSRGFFNKHIQKFVLLFRKIGIEVSEKEVVLLNGISYLFFFLIIFLINKNIVVALFWGLTGLYLPYLILSYIEIQRAKTFEKLFGDALYLIANTLSSGFSFKQALQIIAREMPSPISDEFEILNQELNWGLSLNEALQNLTKRVPNEYVNLFVTAVMIQNEAGGSLASILDKIAKTIKTKQELRGEIKVLTTQGKTAGIIVGIMPFFISFLIFVINPDFILPLFQSNIGLIMIAVAVILELLGLISIKLITNVE